MQVTVDFAARADYVSLRELSEHEDWDLMLHHLADKFATKASAQLNNPEITDLAAIGYARGILQMYRYLTDLQKTCKERLNKEY